MFSGSLVFSRGEEICKFLPAVDKAGKRCLEHEAVKCRGDAGVFLQGDAKGLLEKWALDDDGVNLILLSTVVALLVAYEERVLCSLGTFCSVDSIIWLFGNPLKLVVTVFLLVQRFGLDKHAGLNL